MKKALLILGSAAAEAVPSRFCGCECCRTARKNGGKDIRNTTSYALNERVRIDFGPDAYHGELKCGLDPSKMKHLFFTHAHRDHFDNYAFSMRQSGFAKEFENPLHVYGRPTVWQRFLDELGGRKSPILGTMQYHRLELLKAVELEDEDMTFYPIPAYHYEIDDEAVFFVIRHGKSWLLIANDTGFPDERFWQWLADNKVCFDVAIMDCTMAAKTYSGKHMGGECIFDVCKKLREYGAVNDKTKLTVNHFSHNYNPLQSELEAYFNPHGIAVGYDGMEITYGEE